VVEVVAPGPGVPGVQPTRTIVPKVSAAVRRRVQPVRGGVTLG
jgi:hypothetical protein